MDNKEFSKILEKRTRLFGVKILKLSSKLPDSPEGKSVRYQLSKAGTSIGANYRETNRSRSKADFINKVRICEGEASETDYWLEVSKDMDWIEKHQIEKEMSEARELLALFTSIGSSSRKKSS